MIWQLQYYWHFNFFIPILFMALCWISVDIRPSAGKQWQFHQHFPTAESSSNTEVAYLLVWRRGKFSCTFNCELTQKTHPLLKAYPSLPDSEERVQDSEDAEANAIRLENSIAQALLQWQPCGSVPVLPRMSNTDSSTSPQVRGRQRTPFL